MGEFSPSLIITFSLLPVFLAFIFFFFIYYRTQRESQVRQNEMELKRLSSEMEMKALRSQMNPHFIFNCLQSVYQFILKNENDPAGEYLLKFSKLIRLVLENSLHSSIPLEDELEALTLYVELEKLRLKNTLHFNVEVESSVDPSNTFLPPLLLQPYVENSIWHGLNGKDGDGSITVQVKRQHDLLHISIEDDGIKSPKSNVILTEKKQSLGSTLTKERIQLLNRSRATPVELIITEKTDKENKYSGRLVEFSIPFESDSE